MLDKSSVIEYNDTTMKRRMIIALIAFIISVISLVIGLFALPQSYHSFFYISSLLLAVFAVIYFLFGMPRVLVYFVYALIFTPSVLLLDDKYFILLSFLFTIIAVLNPLASLEQFLDKKLQESETKSYKYIRSGKYYTFFQYKKHMKEFYHFPQVQKLFVKPAYKFLRNSSVLLIFSLLVFLLFYSAGDILRANGPDEKVALTLFFAIVLSIALKVLYISGFTSMFRVFKVTIFPPIIYLIIISGFSFSLKTTFVIIAFVAMLGLILTEIFSFYMRVTYNRYHYYDPDTQQKVSANALYEPFIYNKNKLATIKYQITTTEENFKKKFNEILVYTNFYKIIITAYTISKTDVFLYTEFYNLKHIDTLEAKLNKIFKTKVVKELIADSLYYEKTFLHNHEYIIARALSLASMLDEFEIQEPVIISTSMYFNSEQETAKITAKYPARILDEKDKYCLIEVLIKTKNIDYIIESSLRNLLLDMLVYGGTFVRVMVYY